MENTSILFSFIIPVYNAAATLKRCLDSILARTTQDYEIILINDSSTDNSLPICEEYAAKYPQVSVYTYPNGGAGAARNRGLEKAQGEYILFCDSDDWYNSEELNKLLDSADEQMQDIDLLCFDYRRQWVDYYEDIKHFDNGSFELKDKKERLFAVSSSMLSKKFGIILWNKIYKRELIEKNRINFPERDALGNQNDWGEDLCFNIQYLLSTSKILVLENIVYINTLRIKKGETENHYIFSCGVFNHMTEMLFSLKDNFAFSEYTECGLYDIYIFHIYNYIIWEIGNNNIIKCRELFKLIEKNITLGIIKKIILWKHFSEKRFSKYHAKEYKYMLLYCITGNMFLYKMQCKLFLSK